MCMYGKHTANNPYQLQLVGNKCGSRDGSGPSCMLDTAGPTARGLQECSNACPAHAELTLYTSRDHVDHKPLSSAPTPTDNNTHNIKVVIIKWYYTPIPLTC